MGISVSRVGGSAQIKSMKKIAGTLKLDQAQFREMEAFAKFGSDLDKATQLTIDRGRRNLEILKQGQYSPVSVENQVAIIFVSTNGFIDDVPTEMVKEFEVEFLNVMSVQHSDVLENLAQGKLEDSDRETMEKVAKEVRAKFHN